MRRLRLAPLKYGFSSEEDAGFLSDKFMAQDPFKELLNDLQEFRIVEVISQKELAKRFPLTYEELEEETGYTPKKLYKLGGFYLSPGYSTEYMHIFVAEDLVPGRAHPEPSEVIKLRDISIEEAISMVKKGIIDDAKTVLALLLYQALHI